MTLIECIIFVDVLLCGACVNTGREAINGLRRVRIVVKNHIVLGYICCVEKRKGMALRIRSELKISAQKIRFAYERKVISTLSTAANLVYAPCIK